MLVDVEAFGRWLDGMLTFPVSSSSDSVGSAPMPHLALAVRDEGRSRRFYETYFGFGAEPAERMSDGVLMLSDGAGYALALKETDEPISLPGFLHFAFRGAAGPDEVRAFRDRLRGRGSRSWRSGRSPTTSASSAATPTATSSRWPGHPADLPSIQIDSELVLVVAGRHFVR